MDQWNSTESAELIPPLRVKESMTKEARIHNGEKTIPSTRVLGKLDS